MTTYIRHISKKKSRTQQGLMKVPYALRPPPSWYNVLKEEDGMRQCHTNRIESVVFPILVPSEWRHFAEVCQRNCLKPKNLIIFRPTSNKSNAENKFSAKRREREGCPFLEKKNFLSTMRSHAWANQKTTPRINPSPNNNNAIMQTITSLLHRQWNEKKKEGGHLSSADPKTKTTLRETTKKN